MWKKCMEERKKERKQNNFDNFTSHKAMKLLKKSTPSQAWM